MTLPMAFSSTDDEWHDRENGRDSANPVDGDELTDAARVVPGPEAAVDAGREHRGQPGGGDGREGGDRPAVRPLEQCPCAGQQQGTVDDGDEAGDGARVQI